LEAGKNATGKGPKTKEEANRKGFKTWFERAHCLKKGNQKEHPSFSGEQPGFERKDIQEPTRKKVSTKGGEYRASKASSGVPARVEGKE